MIYAEQVNNTALLGFHPDFFRQQNDERPVLLEELEAEYEFDMSDSKWAGVFLAMIGLLILQLVVWPIIKIFGR